MMFPSLEPSWRRWDPGEIPVATVATRGSSPIEFLQSDQAANPVLVLGFDRRFDAEDGRLIRLHYDAQDGDQLAFLLPELIWAGHTSTTLGPSIDGYFRYAERYDQSTGDDGLVSTTVKLLAINDPGVA